MSRIIIAVIILLLMHGTLTAGAIVSDGGTRDTLSIPFAPLDSIGNAVDLASGDSIYVVVFSPGGAVVFKDSMAYNDANIKSYDWEDYTGGKAYVYTDRVTILCGASSSNGVYTYQLEVQDNSSADLASRYQGWFQVINAPLEGQLDSAAMAARALDSLALVIDSLYAALDSLQSQDDWIVDSATAYGAIAQAIEDSSLTAFAGSGLYAYDIYVYDSASSQVIPGVNLAVRNLNQTVLIAIGCTDTDGRTGFNLDASDYLLIGAAPGYIFDNHDTITVAGAGQDTLFGYPFDPGSPADPDLCRVYGFLYDISGNPEIEADITAWLPGGAARLGSTIISPYKISTVTDSTGYFYLDLIPGSELSGEDNMYEITIIRRDGTILRERVAVPDQASWMLTW